MIEDQWIFSEEQRFLWETLLLLLSSATKMCHSESSLIAITLSFCCVNTSDPNWHLNTPSGPAPSQSDFQNVLGSLTTLEILGDYHAGTETVGLDNVALVQAPEPGSLGVLSLSAVMRWRSRR